MYVYYMLNRVIYININIWYEICEFYNSINVFVYYFFV